MAMKGVERGKSRHSVCRRDQRSLCRLDHRRPAETGWPSIGSGLPPLEFATRFSTQAFFRFAESTMSQITAKEVSEVLGGEPFQVR